MLPSPPQVMGTQRANPTYSTLEKVGPEKLLDIAEAASAPQVDPTAVSHQLNDSDDSQTRHLDQWQMDSLTQAKSFSLIDQNADGQISLDEVIQFMMQAPAEDMPAAVPFKKTGKDKIEDAFKALDTNNDGYLSFEELYGVSETEASHGIVNTAVHLV